jgi:hypothetical protein
MSQALRVAAITKRPLSRIDGVEYDLVFEIGTFQAGSFAASGHSDVVAQVSGTLQAIWNLSPEELGRVAATLALPHVIDSVHQGQFGKPQTLKINTYSAPHEVPPVRALEGSIHPLAEPQPPTRAPQVSFLSDDISEVRDQINALAKSLWGDRVLQLSQERSLIDMYKNADTQTEFRARIQSLGGIAKDLNRTLLAKVSGTPNPSAVGDFILLEQALATLGPQIDVASVTSNLKHINYLRQGYPAHGDNSDKFLLAHRHLTLPYPVQDFGEAWERIPLGYFGSMKALLELLSRAWQTSGAKK